jgi:hypothetical protein
VGPGLLFRLVFGPRTPDWTLGLDPWSLAAFSIYYTSQIKSKMISDVYVEPCGWQGQNGHTAYRSIKGGIRIYYSLEFSLSLSLSLSLSPLFIQTLDWLDHRRRLRRPTPGRSFLFCRPRHGWRDVFDDATSPDKNCINPKSKGVIFTISTV